MIVFGLFTVFVVVSGFIAAGVGYLTSMSYPGVADLVLVGVFTVLLWPAWTLALRIAEHYWPEKEEPAA